MNFLLTVSCRGITGNNRPCITAECDQLGSRSFDDATKSEMIWAEGYARARKVTGRNCSSYLGALTCPTFIE